MDPLLFYVRGGRRAQPETRAWAALIVSRIFLVKGYAGLSSAYLRLSASLFRSSTSRTIPSGLFVNRALVLKTRGKIREAAALLSRVVDQALGRGETLAAAKAAANLALCMARLDRAEEAESYLGLAERSYRALGCDEGLIRLNLTRGLIGATRGGFDAGVERIGGTLASCGSRRFERERIIGQLLLAEIFLSGDDRERAREALDCVAASQESLRRYGPQRVRWLQLEHELNRRIGDREAAARFLRMEEEARMRLGLGPVQLGMGSVGLWRGDRSVCISASAAREPAGEEAHARMHWTGGGKNAFITANPRVIALLGEIERAARLPVPILVTGESGVGKELVARLIHGWSGREQEPFIPVNVAALPAGLFESVVFGHERGAFTGAFTRMPGLLESAGCGTIFLDEIGELAPTLQVKLLRLIDRGEYLPLGRARHRTSSARIVAATNRDLSAACAEGRFRKDLYYRLATFVARIPSLRERHEDIPVLARCLLERACERYELGSKALSETAIDMLARYNWPGNVRELESEILRAALAARGVIVRIGHFSPHLMMETCTAHSAPARDLRGKLMRLEREEILDALRASGGRCGAAAALLGLRRTTLIGRMKRLGIER